MVSSDVQTKLNFESFFDRFWKNKENAKCTYKNGVLKVKKKARVSDEEKKSRPRTELFSNHESTDNSKEKPKFRSRSELFSTHESTDSSNEKNIHASQKKHDESTDVEEINKVCFDGIREIVPVFTSNRINFDLYYELEGESPDLILPPYVRSDAKEYYKLFFTKHFSKHHPHLSKHLKKVLISYFTESAVTINQVSLWNKQYGWCKEIVYRKDDSTPYYKYYTARKDEEGYSRSNLEEKLFRFHLRHPDDTVLNLLFDYLTNEDISALEIMAFALHSVTWSTQFLPSQHPTLRLVCDSSFYDEPNFALCIHGLGHSTTGKEIAREEIAYMLLDFTKSDIDHPGKIATHLPNCRINNADEKIDSMIKYGDIPIIIAASSRKTGIITDRNRMLKLLLEECNRKRIMGSLVFLSSSPVYKDQIFNVDLNNFHHSYSKELAESIETVIFDFIEFQLELLSGNYGSLEGVYSYAKTISAQLTETDCDYSIAPKLFWLLLAFRKFLAYIEVKNKFFKPKAHDLMERLEKQYLKQVHLTFSYPKSNTHIDQKEHFLQYYKKIVDELNVQKQITTDSASNLKCVKCKIFESTYKSIVPEGNYFTFKKKLFNELKVFKKNKRCYYYQRKEDNVVEKFFIFDSKSAYYPKEQSASDSDSTSDSASALDSVSDSALDSPPTQ